MMFGAPDVWDALMRKIAGIAAAYLAVQVAAGASRGAALRLLGRRAHAGGLPALRDAALRRGCSPRPASSACRGSTSASAPATCSPLMGEAGADVVGVDWRTPLASAIPLVGDRAVQGNLDPTLVFAPTEVMTARAAEIIEAGRAARGPRLQPRPRRDPVAPTPTSSKRLTEFVQGY